MHRILALVAAATALLSLSCGSSEARTVLRFSGIPDSDKATLETQYAAVTEYLSAELGIDVEYVHAPDYTGAVTSLAANKLDLVWLGGVTAVQSEERTDGDVTFIASRDTDLRFKTYFIAHHDLVEEGTLPAATGTEPMPLDALTAMKAGLADLTFTFGSKSSTSGHLMPRHFLGQAGVDPETDFSSAAGFQLQGGHSATLAQVASGAFDVGALNYTTWESADEETKARAPVVYVTPHYVDYCMVAHDRLGEGVIGQLRDAFEQLDGSRPEHATVLEAFGATRFVTADPAAWDDIRAVMADARAKGVLE